MVKLWRCVCLLMALATAASAQTRGKAQVFAPGVISGKDVFGIAFTPDGKTAFFCQTDPEIKHIQILESHLSGTTWSEPKAANFSSGTYRDIDPLVTPDGKHFIFQSNRPFAGKAESRTDFDVYVMDRKGSDWSDPRPLTAGVEQRGERRLRERHYRRNLLLQFGAAGRKGQTGYLFTAPRRRG